MASSKAPRKYWAWQFLRRNAGYRADYRIFRAISLKLIPKYGPVNLWTEHLLLNEQAAWHYSPAKTITESDSVWRVRAVCEGHDPLRTLVHKGLARRWGLTEMADPNQESSQAVSFLVNGAPRIWHRVEDIDVPPEEAEGDLPAVVYAKLYATKNATRQLAALRKELVAQQRRLKKEGLRWRTSLHAGKWPDYLRVLDGFESAGSAKELAKQVFPHVPDQFPDYLGQARVRATHEQALLLVQGGYRHIVNTED